MLNRTILKKPKKKPIIIIEDYFKEPTTEFIFITEIDI